jgi:hypothetical protein
MTYIYCKKLIANGNYDKDKMQLNLDIFLLNNRITQAEYEELTALLNG